jgi:hypothetical protein
MRLAIGGTFSFFLLSLAVTVAAQTSTRDIAAVFAEGEVDGNEYRNDYFGLTLRPVGAEFAKGGFISSQGKRARLIDAEANAKKWEDKYSIAVLADALSANPLIHSPEQYVRSVRHQFEKEGMQTVEQESSIEISGLPFVQATMKTTQQGLMHYQGMYTTFLNGYILSLQVEAPSPERLRQIVLSMVQFKAPSGAVVFRGNCPSGLPGYGEWFQQTRLPRGEPYVAPDERKQQIVGQYRKLKLHMSLEEVEDLLGKPDFSTPRPRARLATSPTPGQQECGNEVAYIMRKNRENMADTKDEAVYLFFSTQGRLYWVKPQNLPNLRPLGSPTEIDATSAK